MDHRIGRTRRVVDRLDYVESLLAAAAFEGRNDARARRSAPALAGCRIRPPIRLQRTRCGTRRCRRRIEVGPSSLLGSVVAPADPSRIVVEHVAVNQAAIDSNCSATHRRQQPTISKQVSSSSEPPPAAISCQHRERADEVELSLIGSVPPRLPLGRNRVVSELLKLARTKGCARIVVDVPRRTKRDRRPSASARCVCRGCGS